MAERKANSLTPKQQAIINLNSYPQYLRAGAGTGKTEVLIQKIIHIIRSEPETSLRDFGIITFTNKATDEMRMRLTDSLYHEWLNVLGKEEQQRFRFNVEIASMIDLSTIHGFCENLLRKYGLTIGVASNFKIKSFRHKINEVIGQIVNENYDHPLVKNIPQYKINKLMSILLISNSDHGYVIDKPSVDKANFSTKENDYWNEVKRFFLDLYLKAYKKIEESKRHENTLTPNDLVKKTVELLSNEHILSKLSNKYKYLFIDEFQDTNTDQFDLVNLLITAGVKVFLVGDDKQSVYAFRGADIQNSRQMSNMISQLQTGDHSSKLDENFRTDASLISIINDIFKHNFTFNEQKIAFPLEPLSIPASKVGTGVDEPIDIFWGKPIVEIITYALSQDINRRKVQYSDIAILCRTNYDLNRIAEELKSVELPIEVVGGKGFYAAKEILDIYKVFNAVINKAPQYQSELIFTDIYKAIITNVNGIKYEEFQRELEEVFRRETVEEILTYIYDKSCIFDYYVCHNNYQAISNLHKLKDISRSLMNKDNMQPLQFLEYLHIMISTGQEEDEADVSAIDRNKGTIKLYSIHRAKGLSFPIVIVPHIDNKLNRPVTRPKVILELKSHNLQMGFDKDFLCKDCEPDKDYISLLKNKTIEILEEEIRIFYVACTRAEHRLLLATEKSHSEIIKTIHWNEYASIAKWICEIEIATKNQKKK